MFLAEETNIEILQKSGLYDCVKMRKGKKNKAGS